MKKTILNLSDGNKCWVGQSFDEFVDQHLDVEGNFKDKAKNIFTDIDGEQKRSIILTSHIVSINEE